MGMAICIPLQNMKLHGIRDVFRDTIWPRPQTPNASERRESSIVPLIILELCVANPLLAPSLFNPTVNIAAHCYPQIISQIADIAPSVERTKIEVTRYRLT